MIPKLNCKPTFLSGKADKTALFSCVCQSLSPAEKIQILGKKYCGFIAVCKNLQQRKDLSYFTCWRHWKHSEAEGDVIVCQSLIQWVVVVVVGPLVSCQFLL